jgi:TonB family protein
LLKRSLLPSFLFLLVLGRGSVLAQEAADKESVGFVGNVGVPDGTNGTYVPRLVYSPNPVYTDVARRKRIQGLVLIGLTVNPDGTASDLRVLDGLEPDSDKQAVETVTKWKFKPGIKGGHPVAIHIAVEVSFRLDQH